MVRAVVASWDPERGVVFGSNNNPIAIFPYVGDMQKDAETFARMARYLNYISPCNPPESLPKENTLHDLPGYSEADLRKAQVFTSPGHAQGNGLSRKPPTVSNEAFMDALGELDL